MSVLSSGTTVCGRAGSGGIKGPIFGRENNWLLHMGLSFAGLGVFCVLCFFCCRDWVIMGISLGCDILYERS